MFSIIYNDRIIAVDYFTPIIGMKWREYTIIDINYYSKAVWVV